MKKQLIAILALLTVGTNAICAQEVNTLYFLENAPMRHKINPAFQPVSNVFVGISPLHYTSLSAGNNALAFSDLVYKKDGKMITGLYPGETDKLTGRLKNDLRLTSNAELALLNFGARTKDTLGYFYVGLNEKIEGTVVLPGDVFGILSGGLDETGGRTVNLKSLSANINAYAELSAGYSRKINDKWTVGGKLKFLYGNAFADLRTNDAYLKMYPDRLEARINGDINLAAPMTMPERLDKNEFSAYSGLFATDVRSYLKPQGFGGAADVGFTYNPDKQFRIAVSVTDLGFVYWKSTNYAVNGDTVYTGPVMHYNEINSGTADEQNTGFNAIIDTIGQCLSSFAQNSLVGRRTGASGGARMTNTRLHVGLDANFWNNKFGIGVYSQTQFRNRRVYEEVTLGLALRPVNWFNLALSYSFMNGRWNSMGFGFSFMPYDGLNLTLMTDYIPFSYADVKSANSTFTIPYKAQQLNLGIGVTIVFGTNPSTAKRRIYVKDLEDNVPTNTNL